MSLSSFHVSTTHRDVCLQVLEVSLSIWCPEPSFITHMPLSLCSVGLPELLQFPCSVEMSKLLAGGRGQSTQRGPLNYANIAFEGLGSFRDYVNKEISTINEKSKISVAKILGHWSNPMAHCGEFLE